MPHRVRPVIARLMSERDVRLGKAIGRGGDVFEIVRCKIRDPIIIGLSLRGAGPTASNYGDVRGGWKVGVNSYRLDERNVILCHIQ